MKCCQLLLFIAIFGGSLWQLGQQTCVLESDFGVTLNCAFKKSGLFRIRNLGGVKAHIGLGFTVGDELGFKESLSNLETANRRRSSEASALQAQIYQQQQKDAIRARTPIVTMDKIEAGLKKAVIPPFKPIPPAPERPSLIPDRNAIATPALMGVAVPAYNGIPPSISRVSNIPSEPNKPKVMAVVVPVKSPNDVTSTNFAIKNVPTFNNNELLANSASPSLQSLLAGNNVTEEMLQQALLQRQQLMTKIKGVSTTTTTTNKPHFHHKYGNSAGKVMNAPKEYYPVGYDKNFDDNFTARVELPETSFYCGDQKHFPGLYADEDLGCMVFHVCALTDDGLIMKSFLCPESTLFDQAILKCNWWFYVDCKNSKKLYDSNIPISKSYQLMKALTFFSGYKKESSSTTAKPKEKD